jgi:8-oxo-dGTP pyrophosphatase MutT (NUDIX family)
MPRDIDLAAAYPALAQPVRWRNTALTGCHLVTGAPDTTLLQSVNLVPFVGDRVIVIALESGHIMLPGGTREAGETLLETITREMEEETGYRLRTCHPFAALECVSYDATPWRPHLPHPAFERLVCFGDVLPDGFPTNPADAEQIARVELLPVPEAVAFLRDAGRPELADVYRLAADIRATDHRLVDLCVDGDHRYR